MRIENPEQQNFQGEFHSHLYYVYAEIVEIISRAIPFGLHRFDSNTIRTTPPEERARRSAKHDFTVLEQLFKVEPLSFMLKCLLAR